MSETNKKNKDEKNQRPTPKKTYSKEVMERARKIQAARKNEETKKAAAERKARIARRIENKKAIEAALKIAEERKAAAAKSKINTPSVNKNKVAQESEYAEIAITARKYKTLLTRKYKARKFWSNPSPFEILSYIPGTVISVDVKVGKIVEEGTQLLILEAMKMQNRVDMPFTARIKAINVKPGERIPKDFVMIELEESVDLR